MLGGVLGDMFLERAKSVRKGFEGSIVGKMAGTILSIPEDASLFSPVDDAPPSDTKSLPMFTLD